MKIASPSSLFALMTLCAVASISAEPSIPTSSFDKPGICSSCHVEIFRQHEQSMMSQSYTHPWDEIEYFELAVPHADKEPKVAEVKAGCNGCHAPIAYLAGQVPPPRPSENGRANEGVSCDVCHTITGMKGDTPYNFNWTISPGKTKQGVRGGVETPYHTIVANPFLKTAEFCGTCHNEKSPFGVWVKATHLEWKQGPHGRAGIVCQDCHMPPAEGQAAKNGRTFPDVRQHLFHGAHDAGKLAGVVEVRIQPDDREVAPGTQVRLSAVVVNAKAGHMVPSGSAEERLLWLHVEAKDVAGRTFHLPVDPKGFDGEEYTISSATAMAYQDIGDIRGIDGFKGLLRDAGVPAGDRIFRLPYFDPSGRMTIAQWNTASFGTDYRLPPLQAKRETFTWTVPKDAAPGEIVITARVMYSRLVPSVAQYLKVPDEEWAPVEISAHQTRVRIKAEGG